MKPGQRLATSPYHCDSRCWACSRREPVLGWASLAASAVSVFCMAWIIDERCSESNA